MALEEQTAHSLSRAFINKNFLYMSRAEIEDRINKFLIEEIELEKQALKPEALLKEDLGIDSLDYVDIAVMVENNFGLKIKPEDMKNVVILGDFYNFIDKKVNQ